MTISKDNQKEIKIQLLLLKYKTQNSRYHTFSDHNLLHGDKKQLIKHRHSRSRGDIMKKCER